ncbi:MAG: hypothetical protein OXK75_09615 [Gammaproteobacteria bacterium]|nr:hypothetical protein [Gammaproteobacteria bacterium]
MKTHKIIIGMLILLGVSTYADNDPAYGFTEAGCQGNWVWVSDWIKLYDLDYDFQSYYLQADGPDHCRPFEEEVIATGTPEPSTGTGGGGSSNGGGGSSNGGGGGRNNGNSNVSSGNGTVDPATVFNDEMNEKFKDCWVQQFAPLSEVKNWIGEHTEALWTSAPDAAWSVSHEDHGANGVVNYNNWKELTAYIFPSVINKTAQARGVKFEHMLLYTQMHEYVHLLQWTHDQTDADGIYVPSPYEFFYLEAEAYKTVDKWWRAHFGSGPPVLSNANTKNLPRGFRNKRKKYKEYEEKQANGTLTEDDEKEMEKLEKWFKDPENLPGLLDGKAGGYDPNLDVECDLGENASE